LQDYLQEFDNVPQTWFLNCTIRTSLENNIKRICQENNWDNLDLKSFAQYKHNQNEGLQIVFYIECAGEFAHENYLKHQKDKLAGTPLVLLVCSAVVASTTSFSLEDYRKFFSPEFSTEIFSRTGETVVGLSQFFVIQLTKNTSPSVVGAIPTNSMQ